jgi:hypothetical protein
MTCGFRRATASRSYEATGAGSTASASTSSGASAFRWTAAGPEGVEIVTTTEEGPGMPAPTMPARYDLEAERDRLGPVLEEIRPLDVSA